MACVHSNLFKWDTWFSDHPLFLRNLLYNIPAISQQNKKQSYALDGILPARTALATSENLKRNQWNNILKIKHKLYPGKIHRNPASGKQCIRFQGRDVSFFFWGGDYDYG